MDTNKLNLEQLDKGDRKLATAAVIDSLLKVAASGSVITAGLLLPGSAIALIPLAEKYLNALDKRERERESKRIVAYMKRQDLLQTEPKAGNGLVITPQGILRAQKARLKHLAIDCSSTWDKQWRIVFFDIPEKYKLARDSLTHKLKQLGFYQIQRSVWIHPYPSRIEIETIAVHYKIVRYITYIETSYIDNQEKLKSYFPTILT